MTLNEFLLAWLFNLQTVAGLLVVVTSVVAIISALWWQSIIVDWEPDTVSLYPNAALRQHQRSKALPRVRSWFYRSLWLTLVLLVIAFLPGPSDLWKLRVNLLKLDLASPANVEKLGGHVEEVVKALECKHLQVNCPKPEKESK